MAFKQPLSLSLTRSHPVSSSLTKISICHICGDKARFINYGVLSCLSCKTFFRRHGFPTKNVSACRYDAKCPMTKEKRKSCTACRLAKCLAVGMTPDLIRKEDYRGKNQLPNTPKFNVTSNKIISVSQLPTLNLLSNDRSSLTLFDWRILSNVVHAFDKFSPIFETRQVIEHLSSRPNDLSFDVSEVLALFTLFYTSTETFISSTADFQILTLSEKRSLHQRNLHGVLNLFATFVLTMSGMFYSSTNEVILTSIYGYDIFQQTKRISIKLEHDLTIIKLMLIILAFSSNCYMVDEHEHMNNDTLLFGTFRLLGSQNMYIEILWRYMIYRYGYYEAAIRLDRLVKNSLDLLKISGNAHQVNEVHQNFVDEVGELVEQSLINNENKVVVLWGKTEV